jgi:hypothetical protein
MIKSGRLASKEEFEKALSAWFRVGEGGLRVSAGGSQLVLRGADRATATCQEL